MSEQVIDNQLQEMEAPKQVKDKVNASAKPADAMQKMLTLALNWELSKILVVQHHKTTSPPTTLLN